MWPMWVVSGRPRWTSALTIPSCLTSCGRYDRLEKQPEVTDMTRWNYHGIIMKLSNSNFETDMWIENVTYLYGFLTCCSCSVHAKIHGTRCQVLHDPDHHRLRRLCEAGIPAWAIVPRMPRMPRMPRCFRDGTAIEMGKFVEFNGDVPGLTTRGWTWWWICGWSQDQERLEV